MENTIQLENTEEERMPCEGKVLIKSTWQLKIQLFQLAQRHVCG